MTATKPDQPGGQPASSAEAAKPGYVTGIADGNLAQSVGLRDFLFGVGVVFRLDKRRKQRPEKAEPTAADRLAALRVPLLLLAKVLAPVALVVAGYMGLQQLRGETLPTSLAGTWSTTDGRHAGRSFWLNATDIAFQNGTGTTDFSIHQIKKIRTRETADTLFVTVDYDQGGSASTFSIAYRRSPSPEIRMVNQPQVRWRRTGDAPAIRQ